MYSVTKSRTWNSTVHTNSKNYVKNNGKKYQANTKLSQKS